VVPELQINDLVFNGSSKIALNKLSIIGEQPVKVDITPVSESQPFVEYYWDARDATAVIPAENSHTLQAIYRYPGTYRIGLLAQDPGGKAKRFVIPVTVEARKADVDIQLSTAGGEAPLDVTFDSSETFIPNEEISGFEWKFGDQPNEIPQQGSAVTTHTYGEPGTYTVKMTVTTTVGNQYSAEKTLVVRPPTLHACFTPSRISGTAPMGVIFDSSCTTGLPSEYTWDFGDQTTSDLKKPTHLFEVPGVYRVELKLSDKFDSVSKTTVDITVYEAS
jgi:chitodextrinase